MLAGLDCALIIVSLKEGYQALYSLVTRGSAALHILPLISSPGDRGVNMFPALPPTSERPDTMLQWDILHCYEIKDLKKNP